MAKARRGDGPDAGTLFQQYEQGEGKGDEPGNMPKHARVRGSFEGKYTTGMSLRKQL